MQNPKEKIYSILTNLASDINLGIGNFSVERPKEQQHGDFASNISLVFSKTTNRNPMDLAKEIADKLNNLQKNPDLFAKIEAVKPGFINFYLSNNYLASQLKDIIEKNNLYGSLDLGKGKKASVEYVSANPTGPLHIGNARGGPLGDTIANVLVKAGYKVKREYLHNDVGGQIEKLGEAIYFQLYPEQKTKDDQVQYQGDYIQELAQEVNKTLSKDNFSKEEFVKKAGQIAVEKLLEEIIKDTKDMGISYDLVTKESDLREEVPQVLEKLKKSLKEKEGALWFAPNDEFLKDRETVVRKSDGEYTYFASDIAYHNQKMSQNDIVVDILGSNHSGHVPKIQAVVKSLGFDTNNFKVVLYQYVRLKRGQEVINMSKRAGNFVTAREVLDEVGKDAFRYFLLSSRAQTHMDFDLELAKKKASDNPVFYIQYAHSRICSIFKKAKDIDFKDADLRLLTSESELSLIRHLTKFPYLIEEAAKTLEVNSLTTYALELSSQFHKFYEANQVISDDKSKTAARLALIKAAQITLKNTLDVLGISAPEKM